MLSLLSNVRRRLALGALLAALCVASVQSADTKISALTSGNPAQAGDEIPINRSGVNFKVTATSIAALAGAVTVGGANVWTNTNSFNSNVYFGGTTAAFPTCLWQTADTPDTFVCGLGTTSRSMLLVEAGDEAFDFAHALQTTPTLFIHSANQSTTQWLGLTHDGTNGVISTGTGAANFTAQLQAGATASYTNPTYSFNGFSTSGFGFGSNNNDGYWVNAGATVFNFGNVAQALGINMISSTGTLGYNFTASAAGTAPDLRLTRDSAATLQLGVDVNGAAIDQSIKGHDGITGTDIKGAALTLAPGKGTGAGISGSVILNRDLVLATGTTAQSYGPAWVSCPTKILSNSTGTAQVIATITTTATTGGAVKMFYTTVANNGTLQDTDSGEIGIGWNNNAGTVAAAASAVYGQTDSDASGTLATAPTVTVATNVVSIKFTPAWTTIVPTTVTGFATFEVNGVNSIACQ